MLVCKVVREDRFGGSLETTRYNLEIDETLYVVATKDGSSVGGWQFLTDPAEANSPSRMRVTTARRSPSTGTDVPVIAAKLCWRGERPVATEVEVKETVGDPQDEVTDPQPNRDSLATPIGWVLEIVALDEALTIAGHSCVGVRIAALRAEMTIRFGADRLLTVVNV